MEKNMILHTMYIKCTWLCYLVLMPTFQKLCAKSVLSFCMYRVYIYVLYMYTCMHKLIFFCNFHFSTMIILYRQVFKVERTILSSIHPLNLSAKNFHQGQVRRNCEYKPPCFMRGNHLNRNIDAPIDCRKNGFTCFNTMVGNTEISVVGLQRSFSTDARLYNPSGQTEGGVSEDSGQPQDGNHSTGGKGDLVSTENQDKEVGPPKPQFRCIYFFPPINIIRAVQRFQLLLYSTILPACVINICTVSAPSYLMIGFVTTNVLLMPAVFYIMPRIIGSLFVGGVGDVVDSLQVSRLSFFGNRKNITYKIENVKPLSEVANSNMVFSKFELYNKKEKCYLFHSYSKILDKDMFEIIFGKIKEW